MYNNVSNDFITELNKDSRTFRSRITVNEDTISEIKNYTLSSGSCGSEVFSIGTVFSSVVEIILPMTDVSLVNQEMLLETGIVFEDGSIEYIPLGYFTPGLSDVLKSRDQITVKAYDRITSRCKRAYVPAISFPASIQSVINDLASQTRTTILTSFNTSGIIQEPITLLPCSDALGYISGLLGGFCFADRSGNIRIEPFPTSSSLTISKGRISGLSTAEEVYSLNRISVTVKEAGENADGELIEGIAYSAGSGNGIDLFNPYMTRVLFDAMSNRMLGYTFHPSNVKFLGDPRLDPTDAISAENYADTRFLIPCMSVIQDFDGGLQTTVSAPGLISSDQSAQGPLSQQVDKLEADLMLTKELVAKKITADEAEIRYGTIEKAIIGSGQATSFSVAKLTFMEAVGNIFTADRLTALSAAFDTATAGIITADNINAARASFEAALAGTFTAAEIAAAAAEFKTAIVERLYVSRLNATYAEIDFTNVSGASINNLLGRSAFFTNVKVGEDLTVTGELVGITIRGDTVHGNTVFADALILKGSDGLYYQINADAGNLTREQLSDEKYGKQLDGSVIIAQSVTAEQINVRDLFAQDILFTGKFHTAGKESVDSTGAGIYMDHMGQFATGNAYNFIASWYDTEADKWKIAIRADEISFGTGQSVTEVITNAAQVVDKMQERMDSGEFKGEDAVVVYITSTNGMAFKNNKISTVMYATVFVGPAQITSLEGLKSALGQNAHLQWYWKEPDDPEYRTILATDERLSGGGFFFTVTPDDVNMSVTFMCEVED